MDVQVLDLAVVTLISARLWKCAACGAINVDTDNCERAGCANATAAQPLLTPSEEREFADY
jgi:hypothetical protein